jgi:hypothetical protein
VVQNVILLIHEVLTPNAILAILQVLGEVDIRRILTELVVSRVIELETADTFITEFEIPRKTAIDGIGGLIRLITIGKIFRFDAGDAHVAVL